MKTLLGTLISAQHQTQQAYFQAREANRHDIAEELRDAGMAIADAIDLLRDPKTDDRSYS
jgi:hypothetical protein